MTTEPPDGATAADAPIRIFISYRREDASGQAALLRRDLATRFADEHVFMDVTELRPGENFVERIRERVMTCDVLLALIGRTWGSALKERTHRDGPDYVRVEIETALHRNSGVRVLPVLLDDAPMPPAASLPRSIRRLAEISGATLRHTRWDDDVHALLDRIEELAREPEVVLEPARTSAAAPRAEVDPHYDLVTRLIRRDNAIIPFVGSGVHASERGDTWNEGCGTLPDDEALAAHLAREFHYEADPADLAEISQYVLLTMGKVDLYKALRRVLTADAEPGPLHRFLAELPARLEDAGYPDRRQLIVTTNYDDALEHAFDAIDEPYDLAVYMAQGEHKGKFLHVPFEGEPHVIVVPNTYLEFPIDEDGDIERTIIMKIHGAVDRVRGSQPWRENYVITENDYIDYLSRGPIESLLPLQLLNKMRESHCLFLGYRVRDWNLRVFLQRVWGGQRIGAQSWAIGDRVDAVERRFWNEFGVDVFDAPIAQYLATLGDELAEHDTATAQR